MYAELIALIYLSIISGLIGGFISFFNHDDYWVGFRYFIFLPTAVMLLMFVILYPLILLGVVEGW